MFKHGSSQMMEKRHATRRSIELNVLYFIKPKSGFTGGVTNVAYNLPKALARRVQVTYFPAFIPERSYVVNRLKVFRSLAMKDFDIVHFNVVPNWIHGGYMLIRYAKIGGASTLLSIHGIIQIEGMYDDYLGTKRLSRTLRCCKVADRIVTYSEFMRTNIVTWYRVNRDKIAVIPNGVDVKKFSECDEELLLEGDPAVLYLGYLSSF
jgi:glycosyltransferase involved in cell wall biosynthesis